MWPEGDELLFSSNRQAFAFFLAVVVAVWALVHGLMYGIPALIVHAQAPASTIAYGLSLERNDFAPVSIVPPGTNTYTTRVATRDKWALVFRNGLLQRMCPTAASTGCDYQQSGNLTIAYPPGVIQSGDLVTVLFYQ